MRIMIDSLVPSLGAWVFTVVVVILTGTALVYGNRGDAAGGEPASTATGCPPPAKEPSAGLANAGLRE